MQNKKGSFFRSDGTRLSRASSVLGDCGSASSTAENAPETLHPMLQTPSRPGVPSPQTSPMATTTSNLATDRVAETEDTFHVISATRTFTTSGTLTSVLTAETRWLMALAPPQLQEKPQFSTPRHTKKMGVQMTANNATKEWEEDKTRRHY